MWRRNATSVAATTNGIFFFENQEKELFLVDNTNSKRQLRKEQIVDCGEETDRFRRSSYKTKISKCNQSIMSVNAEIKPLVVSEGPPSHVPVSKEGLLSHVVS